MPNIIEMPKLSDTMTVGTLVKWLKKEGDAVKSGDMLAEIETDKATMELESFFDGVLLKAFAQEGAQLPIGAPLCAIGKPGETVTAPPEPPAAAQPDRPAPAAAPVGPTCGRAAPPPVGPTPKPVPPAPTPAPAATPTSVPTQTLSPAAAQPASPGRIRISPLARKLAAEKRLDPSQIKGTGPGGRVVRADVLAFEKSGPAPVAPSATTIPPALAPSAGPATPVQEEKVVPVSNIRATIARRLVESKSQIPHFYLEIEIDAGPMLALRDQLNPALEKDGVKLSVNDFILKASASAMRSVPAVNCSWEESAGGSGPASIRRHGAAHVSFAVALEDGLITPVVRDAHAKTLFAISAEARALGKLARERKLQPAQYTGGTFCVSNLGMMGVARFSAIINPPNAAILAVGTTVKKPVAVDDRIVLGQRLSLTLSCDHRVVDGATGAAWLAALKSLLERPALLLL